MGQMFMYDWYLNRSNVEEFKLFNLDDIDSAFDNILQLEYNSTINLKGSGLGISITALPAGHSLGGTAWKISKTGEQDIFYAIDHNNKKERHLNGFEMDKISRPGIFITNALNALYVQEKRRKRDEMLLGKMQQTLRAGGNVLISADTAGRALELIFMIDTMWRMRDSGLSPHYTLVFLNNVAFNVIEFAKSQIEWMSEKLIKAFENQKTNPFQLKSVVVCHTLLELNQIASPKVVITSSADLECGFSRDLFLLWCQDPLSCVILTHRTSPGTLGRTLIDGVPRGNKMNLEVKQRVKLEGRELEEFLQKKQNDNKNKRKIEEVEIIDSVEDEEPQVVFASVNNQKRNGCVKHDLNLMQMRSEDDANVFKTNNNNQKNDAPPKKRRFDDYGEIINPEDFKENGKRNRDKPSRKQTLSSTSGGDASLDSEPPTKTISTFQTFSVNCQIHFIDFEGRSDIEAVVKFLAEIQPHQLVIVRGTPQATVALEALVRQLLPNTKISKPSLRKVANLTSGSSKIVQVKLTDSLMSSLELKKVKDCEIAWVDGLLDENSSQEESGLLLQQLPQQEVPTPRGPCVVNRIRISELRQLIAQMGIACEVNNGTLTCTCSNGVVYIQKDSETRSIHIECDGLPEEYYTIRSLLYDQLAMI
ncbi:cleavage and polyadenylation specificity factor subunit 2 isoform X2 [Folsomia candida]|nr:cleavage and polyadenylation specificity factor subunit 2 isoform X2 [Folsomia candida]